MRLPSQIKIVALALLACSSMGGCVSPRAVPETAVVCAKCKMVWVEMSEQGDLYAMSMEPTENMKCPDCESAIVNFFKTGVLEHACSTCGSEFVHCTTH